jgi:steroid 5-alpha reductase family enzyme
MNWTQLGWQLLMGWLAVATAMLLAWVWQRRTRNASVVDVVWTFSTGALAVYYALTADGLPSRRWLIAVLFAAWALRLGTHLLPRLAHGEEDRRYQKMRSDFGPRADLRFFVFFQIQAIVAPLFAAVAWIAGQTAESLSPFDIAGAVLGGTAIAGEWLADRQLSRFRATHDSKEVCNLGLWRYTRHPNYFFEWLFWCSLVLFTMSSLWWWLTLGAPLAMFYFLNFVTGIPPAEAQAIAKRGDEYRKYQDSTSAFFPWPPTRTN